MRSALVIPRQARLRVHDEIAGVAVRPGTRCARLSIAAFAASSSSSVPICVVAWIATVGAADKAFE